MSKSALVILHEGFEEMEAIAPIDILRRGGVSVTVASLTKEILIIGRNSITVQADVDLDQALMHDYDAIVLPGGPGVNKSLRHDPRVRLAIQRQLELGKLVAAICAAPLTLLDAGLLEGKRHTAHYSTVEELPEMESAQTVITDGLIITSQGAGTATAFALTVLAQLTTEMVAREVAESICLSTPQ
ncbi:DJ-1 family glyoxalase III [Cerasicoccus arenae]|uniref:4-methyl-5(B-hydroxyethyl)-thiazole monophosphate biosynthesis protein n=1 Tax=Cerasicoccus arenae TaxID=424488 RepID=A0A8J3DEN3_9BACT|nr:DJ-1 family glyoxalase III [Cerasicoccus arenae]MBK1859759.1 DJ-1/PfpI family protein [Cerasicoccus arenae]GHB90989.1 4-methyl-5(B-hydroxyethyl)-thiazole monophosphate biosynthesis protein [Cerasicoccus arenae]